MMTEEKISSDWKLEARINRLPADQLPLIRNTVTRRAKVSHATYKRVLTERSVNMKVLTALADVLKCTINDVMNPKYKFHDPELSEADEDKLAAELGLSK